MNRRAFLVIGAALFGSRALAMPLGPALGGFAARVFSAWNPKDMAAGFTLSNKNKTFANSTRSQMLRATAARGSGKFYFEATAGAIGVPLRLGIANATAILAQGLGDDANGYGYGSNGTLYLAGATDGTPSTYTTADVIGVAVDLTNNIIYFAKNNVWQSGGNPASGSGGKVISAGVYYVAGSTGSTSTGSTGATLNTGASAFAYTPPSGFAAWG